MSSLISSWRPSLGDRKERYGTKVSPLLRHRRTQKSVTVCVLPPVGKPEMEVRKRNFRTFTRDLKQLRAWLKNCKVTEIAMESTGQYWRSIWNLLEDHFEKLILVNPQHIKGLNGHKTDPRMAQWMPNCWRLAN